MLLILSMMVETKQSVAVKRGDHSSWGVVSLCLCGEIASSAGFLLLRLIHLKRRTRNDGGGIEIQDSRFKIQDGRRKIEDSRLKKESNPVHLSPAP
jgi:hypothetical protein